MTRTPNSQPHADVVRGLLDDVARPASTYLRRGAEEILPEAVTPLTWSILGPPLREAQRRAIRQAGLSRRKSADFDQIWGMFAGYLYLDSTAAEHLAKMGSRKVAVTARRAPRAADLHRLQAQAEHYLQSLSTTDAVPEEAFGVQLGRLQAFIEAPILDLMRLTLAIEVGRTAIRRFAARFPEIDLAPSLLGGLGAIDVADPSAELWQLANQVRADIDLTALFDSGVSAVEAMLAGPAPTTPMRQFATDYSRFRRDYGCLGPNQWELQSPTWGSEPLYALSVIDRFRFAPPERNPSLVGARTMGERHMATRVLRRSLHSWERPLFDRVVSTTAAHLVRRHQAMQTMAKVLQPTRRALGELADRLEMSRSDLFLLTAEEVQAHISRGPAARQASFELISARRERQRMLTMRQPPAQFSGVLVDPPYWELRVERRARGRMPWCLDGIGVAPGSVTGRAKLLTNLGDPDDLRSVDIVVLDSVCSTAWRPYVQSARGVVAEMGSQHGDIAALARALGIPAVVAVCNAGAIIDGETVTIDGRAGTIHVH